MGCDREVIDVEDMEVCDDTNGEVMQPSATSQLDTAYNMLLVSSGLLLQLQKIYTVTFEVKTSKALMLNLFYCNFICIDAILVF